MNDADLLWKLANAHQEFGDRIAEGISIRGPMTIDQIVRGLQGDAQEIFVEIVLKTDKRFNCSTDGRWRLTNQGVNPV